MQSKSEPRAPHWSHGKVDENYTPRERKQGWERFVAKQEKRAAKRAIREERAKAEALPDQDKIEAARKRREQMRLDRLAVERKKRERVFFIGSGDLKIPYRAPVDERHLPYTTQAEECRPKAPLGPPEIVELVGHAEVKVS